MPSSPSSALSMPPQLHLSMAFVGGTRRTFFYGVMHVSCCTPVEVSRRILSTSHLGLRLGSKLSSRLLSLHSCSHMFGLTEFWSDVSLGRALDQENSRLNLKACSQALPLTNQRGANFSRGVILEVQRGSLKNDLVVVEGRDGKRNFFVKNKTGEVYTVRPSQIKFAVPGSDQYSSEDLKHFIDEAEASQDLSLLEIAWAETLSKGLAFNVEEMSLILYGDTSPVKCYSTYRMLSSASVFFSCKDKSYFPLYEPRPSLQVKQLQHQHEQEMAAKKKLGELVATLKSAMQQPWDKKPTSEVWMQNDFFWKHLEALKLFAIDAERSFEGKDTAFQLLDALQIIKSPASALDVLIQAGYLPMHVNLGLLRANIPLEFSRDLLDLSQKLLAEPPVDLDKDNRVDLTSLKVYCIDSDDAEEVDDGLSACKLEDGRLKVWIHVADPTRWVCYDSALRKEAARRCTSIYLPTETITMFPKELGRRLLSLRPGVVCPAVTVSVTLCNDGSISEYTIQNSLIQPTYKISYESASELLALMVDEESELGFLSEAAELRNKWRRANGAADLYIPSQRIKVDNADSPDPIVRIYLDDEMSPAARLVSEMMILCGEVVADFGGKMGLTLPYRGQFEAEQIKTDFSSLPEGIVRSMHLIRSSYRVDMSFSKPLKHSSLGLPGYVQFTSPIRRYGDLIAHYQVKALLRKNELPLSGGHVEAEMSRVMSSSRVVKKLLAESDRYWTLEYLRQQPQNRKYKATVLRFLRSSDAIVFLTEVGMQATIDLQVKAEVGHELFVCVRVANPRKDVLVIQSV